MNLFMVQYNTYNNEYIYGTSIKHFSMTPRIYYHTHLSFLIIIENFSLNNQKGSTTIIKIINESCFMDVILWTSGTINIEVKTTVNF